jgi:hypothetical protein
MPFKTQEKKILNQYICRKGLRKKCVDYLGGKCRICGETNIHVLCFHHKDPSQKEFSFGFKKLTSFEKFIIELDKCELLCKNCHAELHFNQKNIISKTNKQIRLIKDIFLKHKNVFKCEECGYNKCIASMEFHHKDKNDKEMPISSFKSLKIKSIEDISNQICNELYKCQVLCSNCHQLHHVDIEKYNMYEKEIENYCVNYKPLIEKITNDELIECVKNNMCITDIAKKYNCTKGTVGNKLKKLGITDYKRKINQFK